MSFWDIANYVVWGLNALLILYFVVDVIRVESNRSDEDK